MRRLTSQGSIISGREAHQLKASPNICVCGWAGGARRDLLSSSFGTSFPRRMLEAFQKAPGAAQSDHRPAPLQDDILPPNPECEEDQGALCASSRSDNNREIRPPPLRESSVW